MTAVVAGIYASVSFDQVNGGGASADALATGLSRASIALAIFCVLGVPLARRVARRPRPRAVDLAAAAAATSYTLPVASPP
jgi:hypothetical protein